MISQPVYMNKYICLHKNCQNTFVRIIMWCLDLDCNNFRSKTNKTHEVPKGERKMVWVHLTYCKFDKATRRNLRVITP